MVVGSNPTATTICEGVAQLAEHLTFKIRSLIEKSISENVANSGKAKSLICQSRARSLMNSKDKGNIGEAIILGEFVKRNIQVSIPFGDNARYDLVADFNGKLNKIQVKYCNQKITKNNSQAVKIILLISAYLLMKMMLIILHFI